jgi:hypothetical protein
VPSDRKTYQVLLSLAFIVGFAAIAFSAFGLFTVLTGGTTSGPVDADVLGEYTCDAFGGDPEPAHDPDYEVEQTLLGGTEIAEFNLTETEAGVRVAVTTEGRLLAGSARRPDGTNVTVRAVEGDNRLVVEHGDTTPFRLWVDSIGEESTITRTELDVCPGDAVVTDGTNYIGIKYNLFYSARKHAWNRYKTVDGTY